MTINDTVAQDAALLETMVEASSTMDLHRSNLLRMQVQELLEECQLDLKSRKWANEAHEYLQLVNKYVSQFKFNMLVEGEKGGIVAIKDRADKVVHIELPETKKDRASLVHMEPIGCCTKHQLGWTKKSGNAQQLPTFSFMVQIPNELFHTKDYLHYRYFDVSQVMIFAALEMIMMMMTYFERTHSIVDCIAETRFYHE